MIISKNTYIENDNNNSNNNIESNNKNDKNNKLDKNNYSNCNKKWKLNVLPKKIFGDIMRISIGMCGGSARQQSWCCNKTHYQTFHPFQSWLS